MARTHTLTQKLAQTPLLKLLTCVRKKYLLGRRTKLVFCGYVTEGCNYQADELFLFPGDPPQIIFYDHCLKNTSCKNTLYDAEHCNCIIIYMYNVTPCEYFLSGPEFDF